MNSGRQVSSRTTTPKFSPWQILAPFTSLRFFESYKRSILKK